MIKICEFCEKEYEEKKHPTRFCSKSCENSVSSHRPCNKETKEKIRNTLLGQKLSEERKRKISETNIRKKGGVKKDRCEWLVIRDRFKYSSEGNLWRMSVFERDKYTCRKCGISEKKMHAHHILGFKKHPEHIYSIDNGLTLCKRCHINFHSVFGIYRATKELSDIWLSEGWQENNGL